MSKEVLTHERARMQFSATDISIPEGTFRGIASVFGSLVDTWVPTTIEPGAFTRTLAERTHKVKLLWQHNTDQPIGVPLELKETAAGLELHGKISQTTLGKDALTLLRDGVIDELSIGFDPLVSEKDDTDPKNPVRHIKELRLWEISLVTFAADPQAKITAVHSKPSDEDRLVSALSSITETLSSIDVRQALEPCLKVNRELMEKASGLIRDALRVEPPPISPGPCFVSSYAPIIEQREDSPEVTPDPGIAAARRDELVNALLWQP